MPHSPRMFPLARLARAALLLSLPLLLAVGCKEGPRDQLYFDDLKPPLGVGKVKVVSDVSLNPETGGEIKVSVLVDPEVDKDELDRLLKSFYRQTHARKTFRGKQRAQSIDIRVYTDEAKAKTAGDDYLARVYRGPSDTEEHYENNQKPPLAKWAKKAMRNAAMYPGELKPAWTQNKAATELEVRVPMVPADGSGKYVENLSFEKLSTEFSSYVITLFEKLDPLQKLTFIALHNGEEKAKITLTREQYNTINIKHEEEMLGAYHGELIEKMLSKKRRMSEEKVTKLAHKRRHEVFMAIFKKLPEDQVTIVDELKKPPK